MNLESLHRHYAASDRAINLASRHIQNDAAMADVNTLEILIDKVGLYEVLSTIEAICANKADYIRTRYGDKALALKWELAGSYICEASTSDCIMGVTS